MKRANGRARSPLGKAAPAKAEWSFAAPLAGEAIQPALEIGAPDDEFEQEADLVAERVIAMPEHAGAAGGDEKDDERGLQRALSEQEPEDAEVQRSALVQRECEACAAENEDDEAVQREPEPEEEPSSGIQPKLEMATPDGEEEDAQRAADSSIEDEEQAQRAADPSPDDDEETAESAVDDDGDVQRACSTCDDEEAAQRAVDDDGDVQRACSTCDDEETAERAVDEDGDVQRACSTCDDEKNEPKIQRQGDFFERPPPEPEEDEADASVQSKSQRRRDRKKAPAVPPSFRERLAEARRAGGEELPHPLRRFMEARFGESFRRVRVHRDGAASELSSSIQARAFTIGRHIFFKQGEFQPNTQQGQKLVAHELTHVLQQRAGMHSVQRQILQREPAESPHSGAEDLEDERRRAAEALSFDELARFFNLREDTTPPLVFEIVKELVDAALHVITSRESLAVFTLKRPIDKGIRRIIRSASHALRLEVEQRGDTPQVATRWQLDFLDGTRVPATGGQSLAIGTDEDAISVGDTGRPKTAPTPAADVASTSPQTLGVTPPSSGDTATPSPTAAGATRAEQPEAATPEPGGSSPGAEPATAAAPDEAAFPASPEEDPNFQAVKAGASGAAGATSEHTEGAELAANAKDAATVNPGEQASQAQANKADQMQSAQTPGFDKAAFVKAVLDKVRATAPQSLEQAGNFKRDHGAGLENTVNQSAAAQTDKTAAELKTVTDAAPNVGAVPARPAVELDQESVGAPPADIKAERAVPPERPRSQVEGAIEQNQSAVAGDLASLGLTNPEETFAKSNDPDMLSTLGAKQAFDADAATAAGTFREGEDALRAGAMTDASALGREKVAGMFASRQDLVGQVAAGQRGGKTSSETKRTQVVREVNRIFTSTETKVKTRLSALKETVFSTFKAESQRALDTFTSRVVGAEQRWEDKGFLDRTADKIGSAILGIPTELEADLRAIREAFISEMTQIVERIAITVERELAAAKDEIATGRSELKTFLDGLDPSLATLKQELTAQFQSKFSALDGQVRSAEKGLIDGLAEQFKTRLEESEALLAQVRERNTDFFDVVAAGIAVVREKTIGLLEKLQQVFQDGVETLMRVLDDPITFAANLLSGIAQGVQNFAANIGKHLKAGLLQWLTGSVAAAGVNLPTSFDVKSIVGFILELLGLTIENVKARARVIWGEKIVRAIELGVAGVEKAMELFNILQNEGVSGLFNYLKEKFVEFKDQALEKIRDAIGLELVQAAIKKILSLLIPGGAFLQAILSIVDAVFFFIRNADRLADLVSTITSAVKDILAGNVGALAAKVESVLASTVPIVLDFLATLIGIGGKITDIIRNALRAVTQPIQDAIDAVLLAIKKAIGGVIDRILGRGTAGAKDVGAEEVAPGTPMSTEQILELVGARLSQPTVAVEPAAALEEKKQQAALLKQEFQPRAPEGKTLKIEFKDTTASDVRRDGDIDMSIGFSPGDDITSKVGANLGQPLRTTKVEADFTIALADPLTRLNSGKRTSGNLPEPFKSARKAPSERSLAEREKRKAKALAEGRSFVPKGDPFSQPYVRAHLVAADLGGPNSPNNLTIATTSANATMAVFENRIEGLLRQPARTKDGRTFQDPAAANDPNGLLTKTFIYAVDTQAGPPDREGGDPVASSDPRTQNLRVEEAKLVSSLTLSAHEIIDKPDGSTMEGEAALSISVKNVIPQTFIP